MRRERARQAAGTESGIHVHTDMKSRETGQPYIEPLSAFSPISTSSGTDFFCATAFLKKRIPPARNSLFYCLQHIPLPAERTAVPLSAHWFARLPPLVRTRRISPYSAAEHAGTRKYLRIASRPFFDSNLRVRSRSTKKYAYRASASGLNISGIPRCRRKGSPIYMSAELL